MLWFMLFYLYNLPAMKMKGRHSQGPIYARTFVRVLAPSGQRTLIIIAGQWYSYNNINNFINKVRLLKLVRFQKIFNLP